MLIDPFRLAIALIPLAMYLLLLGLVNLRRRPLLTTGGRDLAVLGLALGGFMVIGPLELFMPQMAAMKFGAVVWPLLIVLYLLCVSLVVLLARPRLVIYNISLDELRPLLADVVADIDPNARWAGESLLLTRPRKSADSDNTQPSVTQLHVDVTASMRHVSLIAIGPRQSFTIWRLLEERLAAQLRQSRGRSNPLGWVLLGCAVLLIVGPLAYLLSDPVAVAQAMQSFLRP